MADKDFDIVLLGLGKLKVGDYDRYKNIEVIFTDEPSIDYTNMLYKFRYLKLIQLIHKTVDRFKPDIMHAHYASSYGFLGALSGFHPYIISIWGSDIFDFPKKSFFHKGILKYNLNQADYICATSNALRTEGELYTDKNIQVIPFGIDIEKFKTMKVKSLFNKDDIVVGTIKTLEDIYGIEYLINTFKQLTNKYPELPLKLLIVGEGSLMSKLKKLVDDLALTEQTIFTGYVPLNHVEKYHNMLTLYVALSKRESFGVSILEASACSKPVIVSNVGGLPEVVEDGVSGFVVDAKNEKKVLEAMEKILFDKRGKEMGEAGRKRVETLYNWENSVEQMIGIYHRNYKS